MENFGETVVNFIGILIIAFIADLILAWPIMLLWNWLMPLIFGLKVLTFWEAFGVMLLCSLLFSNSSNYNKK